MAVCVAVVLGRRSIALVVEFSDKIQEGGGARKRRRKSSEASFLFASRKWAGSRVCSGRITFKDILIPWFNMQSELMQCVCANEDEEVSKCAWHQEALVHQGLHELQTQVPSTHFFPCRYYFVPCMPASKHAMPFMKAVSDFTQLVLQHGVSHETPLCCDDIGVVVRDVWIARLKWFGEKLEILLKALAQEILVLRRSHWIAIGV